MICDGRQTGEWVTTEECASQLGVPESTVSDLVGLGAVQYVIFPDLHAHVSVPQVQAVLARSAAFLLSSGVNDE